MNTISFRLQAGSPLVVTVLALLWLLRTQWLHYSLVAFGPETQQLDILTKARPAPSDLNCTALVEETKLLLANAGLQASCTTLVAEGCQETFEKAGTCPWVSD